MLKFAARDRFVQPQAGVGGPLGGPLVEGKIYTPVYAPLTRFREVVPDSPNHRTFVVIRDPRDTLISWYFSLMHSHAPGEPTVQESRDELRRLSKPQGLALMVQKHLPEVIWIQREWLESGAPIFRYEDIVADQHAVFRKIFHFCELPVSSIRRRYIVLRHNFRVLTWKRLGRREDPKSHLRKGQPGDWRNHFDDELKKLFKAKFGETLVRAGYENDDSW